jgi:hypothetical protein
MRESLDVRKVAETLFAKAKEILQEHGDLTPAGFVLEASGELEVIDLYGPDAAARRERAAEFRQKARRATAVASFTVGQKTYQVFDPFRPEEAGKMPAGWLEDRQEHDCIEMRIEAPGQEPKCVIVPFRRQRNGMVEFGEQWEGPEDFKGPAPPSCEGEEGPTN